jgi:hypothetical protein
MSLHLHGKLFLAALQCIRPFHGPEMRYEGFFDNKSCRCVQKRDQVYHAEHVNGFIFQSQRTLFSARHNRAGCILYCPQVTDGEEETLLCVCVAGAS